ncbi:hypothetical protein DXG03_004949 [Asterophora parasitica]|uniref:Uncharacterized protein n=1 Tax=Asterophora parasitica TaxID=117018 RepID=A0A9P7KI39_9AGAR|nr:hypothetical protein DXG03_004949 [Asterophora parasitica]
MSRGSRGDRVVASGNISHSMRENYQQGVSEYYMKVGSIYRNPHFPGVRRCLFQWLNRWWQMESSILHTQTVMFDMACEWWALGRKFYESSKGKGTDKSPAPLSQRNPQKNALITPPPIGPEAPQPTIVATDPFTSAAYFDRTSLPCSALSFRDIAEGFLPAPGSTESTADATHYPTIDLIICSFALHLVESPSELFSLLWELSSNARWLVIVAPHKKPEIKDGWGWTKWDVYNWEPCSMTDNLPEILHDRYVPLSDVLLEDALNS